MNTFPLWAMVLGIAVIGALAVWWTCMGSRTEGFQTAQTARATPEVCALMKNMLQVLERSLEGAKRINNPAQIQMITISIQSAKDEIAKQGCQA